MLILQRKKGEGLTINGDINITILDIGSDRIKIAIDAPKSIPVIRNELLDAADANREASDISQKSLMEFKKILGSDKK